MALGLPSLDNCYKYSGIRLLSWPCKFRLLRNHRKQGGIAMRMVYLHAAPWTAIMVTLITEQLRKQSLEEPYHKAFTFNASVSLPAVGSSPTISWSAGKTTQEASAATHQTSKAQVLADSCEPWLRSRSGEQLQGPEVSLTYKSFQSSPPPPPKRHCRSLSVPEDLSQCRSTWHPSASKIASVASLHPQPPQVPVLAHSYSGPEHPALCPSPTSACSTPSCCRRDLHPALPRCHSQPCDMRKPQLKRRHDPDVLPCSRPGLDFSKMTQMGNYESLVGGAGAGIFPVSSQSEQRLAFSPAEFLGRTSIGPLSESEEEEEDERKRTVLAVGKNVFFERDYTDLDLSLIEEN
ncbi:hypothetical protein ILYODFUR_021635 [Ilyodon furcidens]|uniref:Family with sequence similarity 53 member C n=1 Tax=Ilyodon furcidens TaxID=33524 RepID=A0ABV0UU61_9TELE